MIDTCWYAAQAAGLRRWHPLQDGQNLVAEGLWQNQQIIAKCRLTAFRFRLDKEEQWLERAKAAGIACPQVITRLREQDWHFLLLRPIAIGRVTPCPPRRWASLIAPLHQLAVGTGWGPLRADDQPRWRHEEQALDWYHSLARRLTGSRADPLLAALTTTWRQRQRGLIHGDLHPGNRIGDHLLDWEQVAIADPLEDACRLSLATGFSPRACLAAWGVDPSSPRATGALLRSVLESAAHPGPRHDQARRLLPHLL